MIMNLNDLAEQLFAARRDARPVESLDDAFAGLDCVAGYALQEKLVERSIAAGRRPVGWKVGLTSPTALALFGAEEPMVGRIFADSLIDDGGTLDVARACSPRIEGELLIEMGQLPDPDADEAALIGSIRSVRPAIEIADSRIAGWPRGVGHATGDNACCGWLVSAGTGLAPTGIDFARVAMEMSENDVPIVAGKGSDCMGSILNVYRWFAAKALRMGWAVQPGDLLLTGAMGRAAPLVGGCDYRVTLTGLGMVTLSTKVAQ